MGVLTNFSDRILLATLTDITIGLWWAANYRELQLKKFEDSAVLYCWLSIFKESFKLSQVLIRISFVGPHPVLWCVQAGLYLHEYSFYWGFLLLLDWEEVDTEIKGKLQDFSSMVVVQTKDWAQIPVYYCRIYGPRLLLLVWEANAFALWIFL